jgi:hypothetical protein
MAASACGEREGTAGGINGMADAEVGDRRGEKPREGRGGGASLTLSCAIHAILSLLSLLAAGCRCAIKKFLPLHFLLRSCCPVFPYSQCGRGII